MKVPTFLLLIVAIGGSIVLTSCKTPPRGQSSIPWNNQSNTFEGARYNNFPGTR